MSSNTFYPNLNLLTYIPDEFRRTDIDSSIIISLRSTLRLSLFKIFTSVSFVV